MSIAVCVILFFHFFKGRRRREEKGESEDEKKEKGRWEGREERKREIMVIRRRGMGGEKGGMRGRDENGRISRRGKMRY